MLVVSPTKAVSADEEDVQRIDEELLAEGKARPVGDDLGGQPDRGKEGAQAGERR
jgi:hypothetical protein